VKINRNVLEGTCCFPACPILECHFSNPNLNTHLSVEVKFVAEATS